MKLNLVAALLLCAAFPASALAGRSVALTATDSDAIALKTSNLRSAFLIRAGLVQYNENASSPGDLHTQLQRHFDVVIALLQMATPRSIEIALARLEAVDDHTWSSAQRANWRQKLHTMRYVQLQRLAAYRDRGRFPLNEGQADHAVPIFVDRHNTACAVGQLMRWSGWEQDVAEISQSNNLVYVPDAAESAVAAWALTSGLTLEEAAMIQPGYGFPAEHNAASIAPGAAAIEKNGLRFENFTLVATNYTALYPYPPQICAQFPNICVAQFEPTNSGLLPDVQQLGLLTRIGGFYDIGNTFSQHNPTGTHWLAVGGFRSGGSDQSAYLHPLGATADETHAQKVVIQFDVSTISSDAYINQLAESTYLYQGGFDDPASFGAVTGPPQSVFHLSSVARDGPETVASLLIDQSTPAIGYYQKIDTKQFSPRKSLTIQSEVWLQQGVSIGTYLLDFNVVTVPEPGAAFLLIFAAIAVGTTRHRWQRQSRTR